MGAVFAVHVRMTGSKRVTALDVFRALAVTLVLVRHLKSCPVEASQVLHGVSAFLTAGGWVGVDLFFVLSGFLIGGLLFAEIAETGGLRVGRFLARRAFKIYPCLWAALLAVVLVMRFYGAPVKLSMVAPDLFFYSSYVPGLLGVGWSLAVEEHFYLLLPFLLLALGANQQGLTRKRLGLAVLTTAGACLLFRAASFGSEATFDFCAQYSCTHLRIDALFFGVLLAYLYQENRSGFLAWATRYRLGLVAFGIAGLVPAFFVPLGNWYAIVPGVAMNWLSAGALLCAILTWSPERSWLIGAVCGVGRQSYATYLLHPTIGTLSWIYLVGEKLTLGAWLTYAGMYLASSLAAGALLTALVERPFLKLREWLVPARARHVKEPAVVVAPGELVASAN